MEAKTGSLVAVSDTGDVWAVRRFVARGVDGKYYVCEPSTVAIENTLCMAYSKMEPVCDHFAI